MLLVYGFAGCENLEADPESPARDHFRAELGEPRDEGYGAADFRLGAWAASASKVARQAARLALSPSV